MVVNQGSSFVIKLVLARLLFPEQFGLVGMATVFIGFVQVFNDLGIGAALIQRKDEDLREAHFHTAFWTGVGWAVVMYLVISFVVAPFAASFYNEPLLESLIPVLGLGILSSPVNLVHKAQLTKKMDFKRIALISNSSSITSGILSLILAFAGAGVWSLAFNSVASFVIAMPLFFMATKWKPKWVFELQAFRDIFGFGIFTTATSINNYLINNIDYLMIGKMLSAQALGTYTFAFILTDTFKNRLTSIVNTVMYPLYARFQSDPEAAKKVYFKVVEYNCIIVYPFMLILIVLGEAVVLSFFGEKWEASLQPMKLLAIAVMVQMLVNSNTVFIRGMGRPDFELKLQVIKGVIYIPILIAGIYFYGIMGAAWAVLTNRIIAVVITNVTFKILKMPVFLSDYFRMTKVPIGASLLSGTMAYLLYNFGHVHFVVALAILIAIYSGSIYLMKKEEILLLRKDISNNKTIKYAK